MTMKIDYRKVLNTSTFGETIEGRESAIFAYRDGDSTWKLAYDGDSLKVSHYLEVYPVLPINKWIGLYILPDGKRLEVNMDTRDDEEMYFDGQKYATFCYISGEWKLEEFVEDLQRLDWSSYKVLNTPIVVLETILSSEPINGG
jgi:hypothetical protein